MSKLRPIVLTLLAIFLWPQALRADDPVKGAQLFLTHCSRCHAMDEQVVGPPLRKVHFAHTTDWMNRWVRNSGEVIRSGDAYAVKLYEQYNHQEMPPFGFLSRQDVLDIGAYILREGAQPSPTAKVTPSALPAQSRQPAVAAPWQLHSAPPAMMLTLGLLALVIVFLGLYILLSL